MYCADRFTSMIYNNGVKGWIENVETLVTTRPAPWTVWPKHDPAGSIDRFFQLVIGLDWKQVLALHQSPAWAHHLSTGHVPP
jgi:hypothetical protein